jgi:hypothetical protein
MNLPVLWVLGKAAPVRDLKTSLIENGAEIV